MADLKGEFETRDGVYCYPLTICDGYIRFLLACRALPSEEVANGVWQVYFGPLRIGRFEERLLRLVDQHDGTTSRNPRCVLPTSLDCRVTDVSGPYHHAG